MVPPSVKQARRHGSFSQIAIALLVAAATGCGGGGGGDGLSGFKSPTGPTLSLDQLTGRWGGRIDTGSRTNMCWNVAWIGMQDGTRASGVMEILAAGQPFVNPLRGTITAASTGSGYAVTLSVSPGFSGPAANCTMAGTGNLDAGLAPSGTGEHVLLGPVNMEWAAACVGPILNSASQMSQQGHLLLVKNSPVSGGC